MKIPAPSVISLALCCGCGQPEPQLPATSWASAPCSQWPQIVLTNRIRLEAQAYDGKGGAFLVNTGHDTLAAAAKHLLLALRSEELQTVDFTGLRWHWSVYPRTTPTDSVSVARLVNARPDEALIKSYVVNRDWLLFALADSPPNVEPLRPRYREVAAGEAVWLVGWDSTGHQRVHKGLVQKPYPYKFLADFAGADVAAMSGAPVLDARGLLVGLHSGPIGSLSWINSTKYLNEILTGLPAAETDQR